MKLLFIPHYKRRKSEPIFKKTGDLLYESLSKKNRVNIIYKKDELNLFNISKKFNPDFILTAGLGGFYPVFLKKVGLLRKPILHIWMDDYSKFEKNILFKKIKAFLEKMIVINSDIVYSISKYREKKGQEWGKKINYFPQGVLKNEIKESKKVKLSKGFNIVYVGMISKQKRANKLIKVGENMDMNTKIYLIGPVKEKLKEKCPKNVLFLGKMKQEKTWRYLKSADIVVLTMDNDSCLKMQDYIFLEKPILALDGQIQYALKHNKTAYITPNLSEGIKKLKRNKNLRIKLSKNLKSIQTYTWDEVIGEYLKSMRNYLKHGKKKRNN